MISARRVKMMSLALLMSGGTVVLTQQWLKSAAHQAAVEARSEAPARAASSQTRILVAATGLPAGSVLDAQSVRWQAWPEGVSTAGYLVEGAFQPDRLAGAIVRTGIDAGEPITSSRIALPGDRGTMATVLDPGYRAVTVNVTAASGVAGFVAAGDRVDVVLTRSLGAPGGHDQNMVSETVLTNVRVLAMDQKAAGAKKDTIVPQTATLEVTPKGAEVVALAGELGKLSLSLRSLADTSAPEPARVVTRTASVDGGAPATVRRPPRIAAAAQATVEVVRGDQATKAALR
jgi:pilus assembly protein CpaB